MEGLKYLLLGALIVLAAFALLMPLYRRRGGGGYAPVFPVYQPYYAHGGQGYRPGVLY